MRKAKPIGRKDQRVVLQQQSNGTSDGMGGVTPGWTTLGTFWASVEPVSGNQRIQAMALSSPVTHRVSLPYRADLTGSDRVVWGSRVLQVHWVEYVDARRGDTVLHCQEGVAS